MENANRHSISYMVKNKIKKLNKNSGLARGVCSEKKTVVGCVLLV